MDHPICGYEHLHRHSCFSLLDGFAKVEEYAHRMRELNQQYLAITDHGTMAAIPQQIFWSENSRDEKGKIKPTSQKLYPIFGCEIYTNRMQPEVQTRAESAEFRKDLPEAQQPRFDKSSHLTVIAHNNVGYSNLVHMTSWGWIHGFYRKPRINHEVLQRYKEGLTFLSGCANSEIAVALFTQGEDAAYEMLEKYIAMFSPHFYLEIMMLDFKDQKPYDQFLIKAHDKYGVPLVLTTDCHYCRREQSHNQRLMLMQQNKRTIQEIQAMIDSGENQDLFELQDTNLWMKSEEEMNEMWERSYQDVIDYELFKQAKENTVKICEHARGVSLDRSLKLPQIPDADNLLWKEILKGFAKRRCPQTSVYIKRVREEFELIKEKGFSSYFLIQQQMTDEARRIGPQVLGFGDGSEVVGPGRGSVCGSLAAYCLRLHDVEPIIHDLRFSRFLSPARGGKQIKLKHSLEPVARVDIR